MRKRYKAGDGIEKYLVGRTYKQMRIVDYNKDKKYFICQYDNLPTQHVEAKWVLKNIEITSPVQMLKLKEKFPEYFV